MRIQGHVQTTVPTDKYGQTAGAQSAYSAAFDSTFAALILYDLRSITAQLRLHASKTRAAAAAEHRARVRAHRTTHEWAT